MIHYTIRKDGTGMKQTCNVSQFVNNLANKNVFLVVVVRFSILQQKHETFSEVVEYFSDPEFSIVWHRKCE